MEACLNESPSQKEGKFVPPSGGPLEIHRLNESPSQKEGKSSFPCPLRPPTPASMKALPKRKGNVSWWLRKSNFQNASMKALPKRKGNSHPKLTRNHAAETGTTREPRGRPTQKVYPNQPTRTQKLVTSQNTTRATRHIYVTYQVLAHKQRPPPDPLMEHPAGVFTI